MDNNMINIDDLFRQRLGGAEEKERAGAWMRMNELLEDKMPVKAAGANWRRMLGYTAGLLLLASATVGSYEAIRAFRVHGNGEMASVANDGGTVNKTVINNSGNNKDDNNLNGNKLAPVTVDGDKGGNGVVASNIEAKKASRITKNHIFSNKTNQITDKETITNATSSATLNSGATQNENVASSEKTFAKHAIKKTAQANVAKIVPSSTSSKTLDETPKVAVGNSSDGNTLVAKKTQHKVVKEPRLVAKVHVASHIAPIAPASASNSNTVKNAKVLNNNTVASKHHASKVNTGSSNILPASNTSAIANAKNNDVKIADVKTITMDKLQVRERYVYDHKTQKGIYHLDTISRDKISMATNELRDLQGGNELALNTKQTENKLLPNASFNDSKSSLNAQKKEASRKNGSFTFLDHFNAMIDNFKYNFKHIQFTPGVSAGINGTFFGPYTLKGFQMGVSGGIALNDNWNVMCELKYFNRLNNNTINDNYATYLNQTGTANYLKYSYIHSFDFSNIQSFEMPISVRCSIKRFLLFGGLNMVYSMAINANEEKQAALPVMQLEPGTTTQPKYSVNDFSSRLGFGYMCGLGYQLTPNIQMDLSMTQILRDDALTSGSKLLSDDLYKQPSLQMTVRYQFVRELKMIRK